MHKIAYTEEIQQPNFKRGNAGKAKHSREDTLFKNIKMENMTKQLYDRLDNNNCENPNENCKSKKLLQK